MSPRTAKRVSWSLWGLTVAMLILGTVAGLFKEVPAEDVFFFVFFPIFLAAYATVGALIASRQSRNAIGWLFLGTGLVWALSALGTGLAEYADAGRIPVSEWVRVADWFGAWVFIPGIYVPVTFLFLLFPDGRLLSRRWRPVVWISVVGIVMGTFDTATSPGPMGDAVILRSNPYAIALPSAVELVVDMFWFLVLFGVVGSTAALLVRFRRSSGERRQQMKWLAYSGVVVAALFLLTAVGWGIAGDNRVLNRVVLPAILMTGLLLIPLSAGVAVLRHGLYEIDVVINKTVVYGLLAAFITAVYVGLVVGIGALIGSRGNLFLSILATALIAVAFQPVRERARHLANRIVYGKRATPYEVLSEFSERMAASYAAEDVLPRMARILGEGTGASRAEVWLRIGNEVRRAATWPRDEPGRAVALEVGDLPQLPGVQRAIPVQHHGELLGAVGISKSAADPLTPAEDKLLGDLAAQAGLVLRNVRLIEELRASRQRIVTAQDSRAKALERNLHDGAQQQLVALTVKLRLAQTLAERDPARVARTLVELRAEAQEALDNLRDLARGIFPPLLADQGLPAALQAQARKSPVPVIVSGDGVGRFPPEVEAGVYFCCLEALQNVAKYSGAGHATVTLAVHDGELRFSVEDDGRGFEPATTPHGAGLQNMADRIAALEGTLEVRSVPGQGTTVSGRLPVPVPSGDELVQPEEGFRERSGSVPQEGRTQ
jgi:signal transduction histidine kinase